MDFVSDLESNLKVSPRKNAKESEYVTHRPANFITQINLVLENGGHFLKIQNCQCSCNDRIVT